MAKTVDEGFRVFHGRLTPTGGASLKMLDESLAISRELGMRPLMERVLSRQEILKA